MSKLSTARQKTLAIRGVKLLELPNYGITDALTAITDTIADRIPSLTLAQVRAGEADASPVVMITDPAIKGLFYYMASSSAADDGTTTIVAGARRYVKDLTLNNTVTTLQSQVAGKQDALGFTPVNSAVPVDNPSYIKSLAAVKVGLGNTDDTRDIDKPVSTLQAAAIASAVAPKANLTSPALTGTPTAPTAAAGTNTTQLATTAFVTAAAGLKANAASPTLTGTPLAPTATPGTNTTQIATTAFVTAATNAKADANSPGLTGTPTAPTPVSGNSTTQIATTAFVQGGFVDRNTAQIIDGAKSHSSPLKYTADLVATYDSRTLVDKGYVDAKIASIPAGTGGTETSNYAVYGNNDAAYAALGVNKKYKDLDDNIKETYTPYTMQSVYQSNGTSPTSPPTRTWFGRKWKLQTPNPAKDNSAGIVGDSKPWNCQKANNASTGGVFRMEIRKGDIWPTDITNGNKQDGVYKERVEWMPNENESSLPNNNFKGQFGQSVWWRGMFMVEPGGDIIYDNADFYTSLMQLHHDAFPGNSTTAGPAVAMDLSYAGTIKLFTRGFNGIVQGSPNPTDTSGQLRAQTEIKRGVWNWWVINVVAQASGVGSVLKFWMNGKEVCNLTGTSGNPIPIGYSENAPNAFYPKFGIYRTSNQVTTAVWFANYVIGTDDMSANISSPDPVK
ncbi:heparin lyase I family protein [Dyadobacter sandarakinus]|uniref:Heparin lyase I family protein n=1 Tax=Dyadobacter sandarakinus TaxID=2747268 RepID=A0ABX7I1H1_9BACT|nr:heparin lyase I family protein [Dyadobacter sandarakinus]QRQ99699.1 heparin lyase I family protein [Dyadobacter sandarakinus]